MTPSIIIQRAMDEGVILTLADAGGLKATGDADAVNRWLPAIKENKQSIISVIQSEGHTARDWLLHYPDRNPVMVFCSPSASHAEILEWNPDAIAAEPFNPDHPSPAKPMTAEDEAAIRAWLEQINETDPEAIADVMRKCSTDAEARAYFIKRSKERN